jgi:competence protein ComEA
MKSLNRFLGLAALVLALPFVAYAGPVNVNTADAETISAELQGVGLSKAMAIVDYRKAHGPFKSVDDLTLVKGIGERTVEINRRNILLSSSDKSKK